MIPKPDGSQRELGIPTVADRLIQQALLQVLQPLIDPTFSEHSHGFRPGRRAHDAVKAARAYVQAGKRVVVDVDLAKFFDRVNHDILIDRLNRRIDDAGVIRLVRAYLNAGIMDGGVVVERHLGTPQGGPLSPLLANVLLDEVDRALEQVVAKLRPYLLGWKAYFGMAQTPRVWRELDEWMRHRLRAIQLKQWKRPGTIYRELKTLGATEDAARQGAGNCHRWWHNSRGAINSVLTLAYFDRLGVPRLS
jgi:retron-type reverse transcriptase